MESYCWFGVWATASVAAATARRARATAAEGASTRRLARPIGLSGRAENRELLCFTAAVALRAGNLLGLAQHHAFVARPAVVALVLVYRHAWFSSPAGAAAPEECRLGLQRTIRAITFVHDTHERAHDNVPFLRGHSDRIALRVVHDSGAQKFRSFKTRLALAEGE